MNETSTERVKRPRSVRMFDDAWELAESRGRGTTVSTLVNDGFESVLDRARCRRCFQLVPVEFGDLTGKPFSYWADEAGKTVTRQHPDHQPVTIGRPAPRAPRARRGQ